VGATSNLDKYRLLARVKRCIGPGSPEDRGEGEFPELGVVVFRQVGGEIIADQSPRFGPISAMNDSSFLRRGHHILLDRIGSRISQSGHSPQLVMGGDDDDPALLRS